VELKAPVKAAAKAVKKAPAKAPVKTAAKAPAKKGATAKAAPAKTAVAKSAVPQKPAVKAPVKAVASKVPTKAAPAKTAPVVAKAATPKTEAKPPVLAQVAAVTAAAPAAAGIPIRSSRPSARLAQITVPSMPQAVASTAAKATFLPSMSTTVLPVPTAAIKKDPKLANNWKNKPVEQLSDAEVLAMPDDEYMNDTQMAFFRLKLVQLKQGILSNAGETTEHLREDTVVVPDPADRATIEEEHALELRTRDRERKLLKKIEQSIGRIDAGDYGYCDETGEPIGVGRLLARPTATLSLEAQQRRELKQKMFGD
jgi:DnaK suppressor protein